MTRSALGALCATVSLALLSSPVQAAPRSVGPAAFGTALLATSTTPYDARWNRAQSQGLGAGARIASSARGLHGLERLRAVNVAVNRAIKYREDSSNWGKGDYWATAAETFGRRAGDCEDYAIAKMQVLRAAGVPASDMFLVVGNDLVARSAHAMLLVRSGDIYWVLDNFHDEVRRDTDYREFRPIMTLSSAGRWLHGYAAGTLAASAAGPRPRAASSALPSGSLAAVVASQGAR